MNNIYSVFKDIAHNNTDTAIECHGRAISYHALLQKTNGLLSEAAHCASLRVAIACDGITVETIALMLALLAVKKSVILIDNHRDAALNRQIIAAANCDKVIHADDIQSMAKPYDASVYITSAKLQDEGYLITTSGSTGTPKIIRGRYLGLWHFIRWQAETFFQKKRRVAQVTNCAFDVIYREILTTLISGSTLVIPDKDLKYSSGEQVSRWLCHHQIDTLYAVPSVANFWLKTAGQASSNKPKLTTLFFAGEKLTCSLIERAAHYWDVQQFVNFYGPSETTLAKCYYAFSLDNLPAYEDIPVGYPLPDTRIMVDDHQVMIHTPYASLGYIDKNPFIMKDDKWWYKTGDSGFFKDGMLFLNGRIDDQVKINGVRVHLNAIQTVLSAIEGVIEASVVCKDGKLYAFYSGTASEKDAVSALTAQLSQEVIPNDFCQLPALPKTASGKVDRLALLAMTNTPAVAQETDTVFQCWRKVSGYQGPMTDKDNVFHLGGDSLDIVGFAVALSEAAHKILEYWDIYENPYFYQIKALLKKRPQNSEQALSEEGSRVVSYPLSPQQRRYKNIYMPEHNSNWCNMVAVWHCEGVHCNDLKPALVRLIERHDSLQSYYHKGVMHLCRLHSLEAVSVDLIDCQDEAFTQRLEQTRMQNAERLIDIHHWPLFRVSCVQSPSHQAIVWNAHHLIGDGYSQAIIKKELFALIAGENLVKKPASYAHYALHKPEAGPASKAYWQQVYQQPYSSVDVPVCYPEYQARGHQITFSVDRATQDQLKQCAKFQGITVFSVLMSAYFMALHSYYHKDDMVIGTPALGRMGKTEEQMVGNFISLVTLRSQDPMAQEDRYMANIHQNIYQAMKHQDYQYDALVQQQQRHFQQDRFPLTTFFISQINQGDALTPTHSEGFTHQNLGGNVKFDMMLYVDKYQDQYLWRAQYRRALFSESDQERFWSQYINALQTLIENHTTADTLRPLVPTRNTTERLA